MSFMSRMILALCGDTLGYLPIDVAASKWEFSKSP